MKQCDFRGNVTALEAPARTVRSISTGSIAVVFERIVQDSEARLPVVQRIPAAYATRPSKRCEYIRARLERDKNGSAATAIHLHQGSGILSSTSWANGLALIPADAVIARGSLVDFLPFSELLS